MTKGSVWMRIIELAEKARDADRAELAQGYTHAARIVEEVGLAAERPDAAMLDFCKSYCFYGQQAGVGEASECGICPIAPSTLGAAIEGEDDGPEIEKRRAERSDAEAREALRKMQGRGLKTLTGEEKLPAQRKRCMTPE